MLTLCMLFVLLLGSFFFRVTASPPCLTMAKWIRRWKPIWIPYGGNFQTVCVEEKEQEVHASENSDQEPEYHWRDPCPRYHHLTTLAMRAKAFADHVRLQGMQTSSVYLYP